MRRDLYTTLFYARRLPVIGRLAYAWLKLHGIEIPLSVKIGKNCRLEHGAFGVVIHPKTELGDDVRIYPGVTLGRADIHRSADESAFRGIRIDANVILGSGAKVLCKDGILTVGENCIIGANAVLLQSTNPDEIWAGNPARCVSRRG